jgi:Flp pilus assembly protein TadD
MSSTIDRALRQAKIALRAGDFRAALETLLPETRAMPANPRLRDALADVQRARTGLPARPFGPAQVNRILQIQRGIGPEAALDEIELALLIDPLSALANGIKGSLLLDIKQFSLALPALRAAHKADPKDFRYGVNLSVALREAGEPGEAAVVAQAVIDRHGPLPGAMAALVKALAEDGWPRKAGVALDAMIAADPSNSDLCNEAGKQAIAAQDFDRAEAMFRKALALNPAQDRAPNELAGLLMNRGALDEARTILTAFLDLKPENAAALYNLARATDVTAGDPLIDRLSAAEAKSLNRPEKILLNFGLAKAFEEAGDPDASFAALSRGNALRRAELPFDRVLETGIFARARAMLWGEASRVGAPEILRKSGPRPIFVLGMMRSGTTLTEQIVSSHSTVYGAGELDILGRACIQEMRRATEAGRANTPLPRDAMERIRAHYLDRISELPTDKPVIVDKMPANFALIGAIRAALPEARILHMQRDPVAVCWSIYQKNFSGNSLRFTNDLTDIAWYFDAYLEAMAFARNRAPEAFLDVDYAELTKTPEPVIRRILDHCELDFEPACLTPEKNTRVIQTASYRQARSGIYQGSTDRWKGFGQHVQPLIDHFAAKV